MSVGLPARLCAPARSHPPAAAAPPTQAHLAPFIPSTTTTTAPPHTHVAIPLDVRRGRPPPSRFMYTSSSQDQTRLLMLSCVVLLVHRLPRSGSALFFLPINAMGWAHGAIPFDGVLYRTLGIVSYLITQPRLLIVLFLVAQICSPPSTPLWHSSLSLSLCLCLSSSSQCHGRMVEVWACSSVQVAPFCWPRSFPNIPPHPEVTHALSTRSFVTSRHRSRISRC
jgi:hypothetical protein